MCPPPSPQQALVTTLNEHNIRSVISSPYTNQNSFTEHATRPQPHSSSPTTQVPASPTQEIASPHLGIASTDAPMQPNPPLQNLTMTSVSMNSNPPCPTPAEPANPMRCDRSAEALSQPRNSDIVNQFSLPMNSRQSITPSFSFPGTSNSATTFDRAFPDSTDSHPVLTSASSSESISSTSQRTPNVYINGLPPHFSEQDLFALARPFGDIKSVRTFTRHVSEKPTGYGFVLFGDAEAAQRCIDGLRKYRNLHPSFSKQVHRIPGTEYAQHITAQSADLDESSFKSRMERLKDTASTNIYIEGLPLSIDEESLAALMLPYKIKSSRFFKTKLSNPPRIIAFVRLETRAAAEETIERLHGRMVRGWNDPGCRISVRFADSAEQRELRRTERTLKNGDQSPSRITIAQAALLNLRGQEFQANIRGAVGAKSQRLTNSPSDGQASFNSGPGSGLFPMSRSLPSKLCHAYKESSLPSSPDLPISPEMDNLLQSMQNLAYGDASLDTTLRSLPPDDEYVMPRQVRLQALASAALRSPHPLPITLPRGHTQARNGFTPAEELILEAHTQRLQLKTRLTQSSSMFESGSSLGDISAVETFGSVCQEPSQASGLAGRAIASQDSLPTISEDEFHAIRLPHHGFVPPPHSFQGLGPSYPPSAPPTSAMFVRPPSRAVSIVPPPPDYEDPGKRSKGYHQHAEPSMVSKQIPCPSFNNRQSIHVGENRQHPSLLQTSTRSNNINSNSSDDSNTSTTPCDNITELQHTYMYSHGNARSYLGEDKGPCFRSLPVSHVYTKKSPRVGEQNSTVKGPKSPVVVSPALTYSSRTPSTLSPATPFFGSFAGSQDAFEVMMMGNEVVGERKLKSRVANK